MKPTNFLVMCSIVIITAMSCKTINGGKAYAKFNFDNLYKVWVVDTIIVLKEENFSTPDLEMSKNEYLFEKDEKNPNQGERTAITPAGPSIVTPFSIEKGTIVFPANAMYPLIKLDENMNILPGSNTYGLPLPPYKIIALTDTKLTINNGDIMVKMRAK